MDLIRVLVEHGADIADNANRAAWVTSDDALIAAFMPMIHTPAMHLLRTEAGYRIIEMICKAARTMETDKRN